jgi:hypothetical protein
MGNTLETCPSRARQGTPPPLLTTRHPFPHSRSREHMHTSVTTDGRSGLELGPTSCCATGQASCKGRGGHTGAWPPPQPRALACSPPGFAKQRRTRSSAQGGDEHTTGAAHNVLQPRRGCTLPVRALRQPPAQQPSLGEVGKGGRLACHRVSGQVQHLAPGTANPHQHIHTTWGTHKLSNQSSARLSTEGTRLCASACTGAGPRATGCMYLEAA